LYTYIRALADGLSALKTFPGQIDLSLEL